MDIADWEIDGADDERQSEIRRRKNTAFKKRLEEQKKLSDTGQMHLKIAASIACVSWMVAIFRLWY